MKGTVKFFNSQKQFGFLTGEDGKDYFVHETGLQEGITIKEGDSVTFETAQGDKGIKAVKVSKN
jgi:CspA family cold shock protein